MKVFTKRVDFLGKKAYKDKRLEKLKEKFKSDKLTYYSVEFIDRDPLICSCLLITEEEVLDFIVEDMEKIESLQKKLISDGDILDKAMSILEKGKPLFGNLSTEEINLLKEYNLVTLKPILFLKGETPLSMDEIFKITSHIFFFTVNKKEARSYLIKKGTNIVEAAGKIHTDLARGFIRAEVFNINDLNEFHNLEEARQKNLLKNVGKDYIVQDGDVVNIKFKV